MKMKKMFALGAIGLSLVFVSCEKEEVGTTEETVDSPSATYRIKDLPQNGPKRIFVDNSGVEPDPSNDFGCTGHGGFCHSLIDLSEYPLVSVANVKETIEVIDHGVDTDIQDSFEEHRSDFEQIIGVRIVNGILDGSITVKNDGVMTESTAAYLQFSTNGKLSDVTPIQE